MPRRMIPFKSAPATGDASGGDPLPPSTWSRVPEGEGAHVQDPHSPAATSTEPPGPVFMLKNGTTYSRVHPERILYLQAQGNYVEVHLPEQRVVLRSSLAEVLKTLPSGIMARVNRAQAVNILRLEHVGTGEVRVGGRSFTLSGHYRAELLARLKVVADR